MKSRWVLLITLLLWLPGVTSAGSALAQMIIYDNDFGGLDTMPLLANPKVKILGLTVVTGGGWVDEEASTLLRFLELAGRPDVPVIKGAIYPLINTRAAMKAWEQAYGKIPWKGVWNDGVLGVPMAGQEFHPDDPYFIPPTPEGPPKIKPRAGSAVQFLIDEVHKHPHQVSILAAGPMTNLALAIRLDPEFAGLAKELVFMGAILDGNLPQVSVNVNYYTDYNFIFDPEAAHIVLTAPWAAITAIGNVSNEIVMTPALAEKLRAKNTPIALMAAEFPQGMPLWDMLAAAVVMEPGLIRKSVEAYMDVAVDPGMYRGTARLWPEETRPHLGEGKVRYVTEVDTKRFLDLYVSSMSIK
jgi:inosine-uridine nucleoside N-ribohydrolase